MSESFATRILLPFAIIIGGFAGIYFLSGQIERTRPPLPETLADQDLSFSGSRLKGYLFGMEGLAADWYYMRSLQYIGDKVLNYQGNINIEDLRALNPRLFYPILENATDLDPHYTAAYSYAGMVLPAIDAEKAIALANKGIANNPEKWRLYQNLGYIYWRLGDYEKAAEIFEKGAAVEGASGFMKLMAAVMTTKGGDRETSRAIYTEMLVTSDEWSVTITAQRRLNELTSLDERHAADKVLQEYRDRTGQCPDSLRQIVPMLAAIKLPADGEFRIDDANNLVDPSDAPYLLDREKCKMVLDAEKTQIPMQ